MSCVVCRVLCVVCCVLCVCVCDVGRVGWLCLLVCIILCHRTYTSCRCACSWPSSFPSTAANVNTSKWQCDNLPAPTLPSIQRLPVQEPGTRLARPLPYEFDVSDTVTAAGVTVWINNTGSAGGVFFVFDDVSPVSAPRKYTVEATKGLTDAWAPSSSGAYGIRLYGPNGFVREAHGTVSASGFSSRLVYDVANDKVVVVASVDGGSGPGKCTLTVTDNAYGGGSWNMIVVSGGSAEQAVDVSSSGSWYDLSVTAKASSGCPIVGSFTRHYMGRMETGRTTTSDPAMAKGGSYLVVEGTREEHPAIPAEYYALRWTRERECASERGRMKDACWDATEEAAMLGRLSEL